MATQLYKQPIHWVDDGPQLQTLCAQWAEQKMLAVDTEFMRSQTYYPIAGLIQVNDGSASYLIDPTAVDCQPFKAILLNPDIVKILHSCSEDLEVFQHLLGEVPVNLLDTQIAAAMCGYGFSVGYANLVKMVLDIDLPKGETRSDWLQRPLSRAQIEYAAIDVEFLYQLAASIMLELNKRDRFSWAVEDCQQLLAAFTENQATDNSYLRIKQCWRLNRKKLAILKALASWREQLAQRRDVPRNRVVKEHSLLDIAIMGPDHVSQLRKFEGVSERMIRSDGEAIIALVKAAKQGDPASFPPEVARPLSGSENRWSKALRTVVQSQAETQQVAAELLLKKRDYEAITRHFLGVENTAVDDVKQQLQQFISGWRFTLLGEALAQAICSNNETVN